MADEQHGALELVEGDRQRLARVQVQVVGGLVQQQQVGPLPDDGGQHQTGALPARQGAHRLLHHVALEAELPEVVAQRLLARVGARRRGLAGQARHQLQRGVVGVQQVHLLLREVAHRQALALGDGTAQCRQGAGDGLHQGGLALAVGPQDADALTGHDRAGDVADDGGGLLPPGCLCAIAARAAVAAFHVAQRQHRVGQAHRLAELEGEVAGREHRGQLFHAREGLDTALRLLGLGGLGLEAVDEALQVGDAVLLLVERRLGLRQALGAHALESGVVAAVASDLALVQVQRHPRDCVQELPVMADDHQRAGVALQPGFQPHQGVQVEVVGGLVQQQQVGRAHQRARQLQPHAPTTREAVDGRIELGGPKAQAQQQGLGTRAGVKGAGLVQCGVRLGHGVAVVGGLGGPQRRLRALQRQVAFEHEVGGAVGGFRHVLGHLAHLPARGNLHLARIRVQAAGQQREQAGLARAVAPHQAGLLARVQGEGGALQHHLRAAPQGDIAHGDHDARSSRVSSST